MTQREECRVFSVLPHYIMRTSANTVLGETRGSARWPFYTPCSKWIFRARASLSYQLLADSSTYLPKSKVENCETSAQTSSEDEAVTVIRGGLELSYRSLSVRNLCPSRCATEKLDIKASKHARTEKRLNSPLPRWTEFRANFLGKLDKLGTTAQCTVSGMPIMCKPLIAA